MALQYRIVVEGLVLGGHPHLELFSNLHVASVRFNELVKAHPLYNVNLYEQKEVLVKRKEAEDRELPKCPRGHTGLVNEKTVVVVGSDGLVRCGICGWVEGEKI